MKTRGRRTGTAAQRVLTAEVAVVGALVLALFVTEIPSMMREEEAGGSRRSGRRRRRGRPHWRPTA
ncbi:hypothetical protein ABZ646_42220, partial [Streptomyces sp. NPDC007162]|uniref:hypothetical protein n=1 Tax=Streptomyces sp. NPDC007162 TaxID=3156917 RepID=UPI0033C06877